MDEKEFEEIFNCDYDVFQLWDTEGNGLIDALEVFSGLIIFTTANFESKVRCFYFF